MRGVRFYLEFKTTYRKHKSGRANKGHAGNVFAAYVEPGKPFGCANYRGLWVVEGVGAILDEPNSPVASTAANIRDWLWKRCKRVSERVAREVHPALFERLDMEG